MRAHDARADAVKEDTRHCRRRTEGCEVGELEDVMAMACILGLQQSAATLPSMSETVGSPHLTDVRAVYTVAACWPAEAQGAALPRRVTTLTKHEVRGWRGWWGRNRWWW